MQRHIRSLQRVGKLDQGRKEKLLDSLSKVVTNINSDDKLPAI